MRKGLVLLTFLAFCVGANAQITNGLLCHLELDNNFTDASGNGLSSLANGTYAFVEDRNGVANSALQISNTPSVGYVQTVFPAAVAQNDSMFTLAFWYNSTKTQTQTFPQVASMGYAVGSTVQNTAYLDSSQFNFSTQANTGSYHTINLMLDTNWNHLAFTLTNSGVLTAYVNGVQKGQETMNSNKLNYTMGGMMLSNFQSNSSNNGDIYDDIYIFDRALTGAEVQQIFQGNPSCVVNIPDINFKGLLVSNTAINTNGDAEIQCTEAGAYTGEISVANYGITDLTGIEEFTNIVSLQCGGNVISTLDLTNNTQLNMLACNNTDISSLDLSTLTLLDSLYCSGNNLSTLDISPCNELILLECADNVIINLDLTQSPQLEYLNCSGNNLASIDLSNNASLVHFDAGDNLLTSVSNISAAPALNNLRLANNNLSAIDLSSNTALNAINLNNNALTVLDFTLNTVANFIYVSNNQLNSLNVQNGNNSLMNGFEATGNPDLTCIQVDDAAWSTTNWTLIDPTASFSENCTSGGGASLNEQNIELITVHPNPASDLVTITVDSTIESVQVFNLTGEPVLSANTNKIDVTNLESGVYQITVTTQSGTSNVRFVKQ